MIQGTPLYVLAGSMQLGPTPPAPVNVRDSLPPLEHTLWSSVPAFGGTVELDPRAYEALVYAAHRHENEIELLQGVALLGVMAAVALAGACVALAVVTWRLSRRLRAPGS
jgi:hypothetical protein